MSLQTKTIEQNGSKGWQKFSLFITENSTNVTTNKSSITYSFQISPVRYSAWDGWGSLISYSISVAGHTKTGTIPSYNGTTTITLATDTFEVEHNTDGNKEIGFSFSVEDNTGASYACGNAYREGTMALTYIPRKTNFPQDSYSVVVGQLSTFGTISPASQTFSHSLKVVYGDSFTKYIDGETGEWYDTEHIFSTTLNSSDSKSMMLKFDAKDSLYSLFATQSATGTITLTTYNGNNKLGEDNADFVFTTNSIPSITASSVFDNNNNTFALTKDRERMIATQSNCNLTYSIKPGATGDTNVSLISLKINDVDVTPTTTSYTIPNIATNQIKVEMTNSRNTTTINYIQINKWVPYTPINGSVWVNRGSQTSQSETSIITSAFVSFYSTYYNGSFDANDTVKNTFSLKWRYKKHDDTTYSEWYTLDSSSFKIENGQIYASQPYPYLKDNNGNNVNFEYHTYYNLEFTISDKLTSQELSSELTSASPVYSWNEFGVKITDSLAFGGESSQGKTSYYGCPIVISEETDADDDNILIAKKLLDSTNHFVNNDYEDNYGNVPGKLFLDATTLITKQNNKWKVPTCWADIMYPIGSIYFNAKNINPNLLFGGTWEPIEDVFILGASSKHPVGSTGGEETTTLTIENLPPHSFTFPAGTNATTSSDYDRAASAFAGGTPKNLSTNIVGGGQAHNNMPPYKAACVWERIA